MSDNDNQVTSPASLEPRPPQRPLVWPNAVHDLQDALFALDDNSPVYIVGGAVRDAYLHHPVHDLDLATPKSAIKLARKIADALDGKVFVMDAERDVARVFIEPPPQSMWERRLVVDVARFRGDGLLSDLNDRDFTANAIAVDLRGTLSEIIDPLDGERDMAKGIIRRCSDHAMSDDPLRALRAIRQSVQFNYRIEPQTLVDIRREAPNLHQVSPERIRDEFFKLLALPRPAAALRVANAVGLLAVILPEVVPLRGLKQPPPHIFDAWDHTLNVVEKLNGILTTISPRRSDQTAAFFDLGMIVMAMDRYRNALWAHIAHTWPNERSHWALLILAALIHDLAKGQIPPDEHGNFPECELRSAEIAATIADRLTLSNSEKKRLVTMIQAHHLPLTMPSQLTDLDLHRFWYPLRESGVDACLLLLADHLGTVGNEINQDVWVLLIEQMQLLLQAYFIRYEEIVAPKTFVTGSDIMQELGLESGKHIGHLLEVLREKQVAGEIQSVEDALDAARVWVEQNL